MKRIITICAACATLLAAVSCGSNDAKVTAIVKGPVTAALVIDYGQPIDPASVTPEAFAVEGEEVVCANVVEDNKVIVVLKKECPEGKPECCKEAEPKPECDKEKAGCPEGKPECCKEAEPKHECDKPEIPVPDVAVQQVADIKAADGKVVKAWKSAVKATEAKPACKGHKHHGKKHCDKPENEQCDDCKAAAAEKAE